ncbi:MAG: isoamylase early set domain-containing protein [Chloroflexota bacterium]|nr:isoamylase early set domain-containing protein [Chloroflexota bacterium]
MIRREHTSNPNTVLIAFEYPAATRARQVHLVGDFNEWDELATPMGKDKRTGIWTVQLELARGREYQFRYLVDQSIWHNDWHADRFVPNIHGSDNSVVSA